MNATERALSALRSAVLAVNSAAGRLKMGRPSGLDAEIVGRQLDMSIEQLTRRFRATAAGDVARRLARAEAAVRSALNGETVEVLPLLGELQMLRAALPLLADGDSATGDKAA